MMMMMNKDLMKPGGISLDHKRSTYDTKKYRLIQLENGLRVLLVSEGEIDTSSITNLNSLTTTTTSANITTDHSISVADYSTTEGTRSSMSSGNNGGTPPVTNFANNKKDLHSRSFGCLHRPVHISGARESDGENTGASQNFRGERISGYDLKYEITGISSDRNSTSNARSSLTHHRGLGSQGGGASTNALAGSPAPSSPLRSIKKSSEPLIKSSRISGSTNPGGASPTNNVDSTPSKDRNSLGSPLKSVRKSASQVLEKKSSGTIPQLGGVFQKSSSGSIIPPGTSSISSPPPSKLLNPTIPSRRRSFDDSQQQLRGHGSNSSVKARYSGAIATPEGRSLFAKRRKFDSRSSNRGNNLGSSSQIQQQQQQALMDDDRGIFSSLLPRSASANSEEFESFTNPMYNRTSSYLGPRFSNTSKGGGGRFSNGSAKDLADFEGDNNNNNAYHQGRDSLASITSGGMRGSLHEKRRKQGSGALIQTAAPQPRQGVAVAAVSMCVGIGSFGSPQFMDGLAHYLEHMLFMGSVKYPVENKFDMLLSLSGGTSNAFTDTEKTLYHFSCRQECLVEVLDVFAQFFIAPLLLEDALDRELAAVDSEFLLRQNMDGCRLQEVWRETSEKSTVFNKFTCGNYRTLRDIPKEKNLNIRQALREFHERYYVASNMSLCVVASESLDKMETYVRDIFASVRSTTLKVDLVKNANLAAQASSFPWSVTTSYDKLLGLGCIYRLSSIQQNYELQITWQLPAQQRFYRSKPSEYIAHLVGHESNGSILAEAKSRGWALSLMAGIGFDDGFAHNTMCSLFNITITLTGAGLSEWVYVASMVFEYIGKLARMEPQRWIFEEIQDIATMQYTFLQDQDSHLLVRKLSTAMQDKYLSDSCSYLEGPYLYHDWNPELIKETLSHLTPEKARIDLIYQMTQDELNGNGSYERHRASFNNNEEYDNHDDLDVIFDTPARKPLREQYMGIPYWVDPVPKELMKLWKTVYSGEATVGFFQSNDIENEEAEERHQSKQQSGTGDERRFQKQGLALPEPNKFISKDFSLVPFKTRTKASTFIGARVDAIFPTAPLAAIASSSMKSSTMINSESSINNPSNRLHGTENSNTSGSLSIPDEESSYNISGVVLACEDQRAILVDYDHGVQRWHVMAPIEEINIPKPTLTNATTTTTTTNNNNNNHKLDAENRSSSQSTPLLRRSKTSDPNSSNTKVGKKTPTTTTPSSSSSNYRISSMFRSKRRDANNNNNNNNNKSASNGGGISSSPSNSGMRTSPLRNSSPNNNNNNNNNPRFQRAMSDVKQDLNGDSPVVIVEMIKPTTFVRSKDCDIFEADGGKITLKLTYAKNQVVGLELAKATSSRILFREPSSRLGGTGASRASRASRRENGSRAGTGVSQRSTGIRNKKGGLTKDSSTKSVNDVKFEFDSIPQNGGGGRQQQQQQNMDNSSPIKQLPREKSGKLEREKSVKLEREKSIKLEREKSMKLAREKSIKIGHTNSGNNHSSQKDDLLRENGANGEFYYEAPRIKSNSENWDEDRWLSEAERFDTITTLNADSGWARFPQTPEPPLFVPALIPGSDDLCTIWYKQDTIFLLPRIEMYLIIMSPVIHLNPLTAALADMFTQFVFESLGKESYMAYISELDFEIVAISQGIQLKFSGFSHKIPILVETVLDRVLHFGAQKGAIDDPTIFRTQLESLAMDYSNATTQFRSGAEVSMVLHRNLCPNAFTSDAKLQALSCVTPGMLMKFASHMFKTSRIDGLIQGNLSLQGAIDMSLMIRKKLCSVATEPLAASRIVHLNCIEVPVVPPNQSVAGMIILLEAVEVQSHSVELYFQLGEDDAETRLLIQMIDQLMREPLYADLRSRRQLGYAVKSGIRNVFGTLGYVIEVTSDKYSPDQLADYVDQFLTDFRKTLMQMTNSFFVQNVCTLAGRKLVKDNSLSDEVSRHWQCIMQNNSALGLQQKKVTYVWNENISDVVSMRGILTYEDVISAYDEWFTPASSTRRRASVYVIGAGYNYNAGGLVERLKRKCVTIVESAPEIPIKIPQTEEEFLFAEEDLENIILSALNKSKYPLLSEPVKQQRLIRNGCNLM